MKQALLFAKIAGTGAFILGLQLVVSRMMTPFFGVSLYVWTGILSVTLLSLALGYQIGGMATRRYSGHALFRFYVLSGALASLWTFFTAQTYHLVFLASLKTGLIAGSMIACFYMLFIPLIILSSLNSVLVALLNYFSDGKEGGDFGAGKVLFVSTMGSVGGVLVVAHTMLPYLTNHSTVLLMGVFAALLSAILYVVIYDRGGDKSKLVVMVMPLVIGIALALNVVSLYQKQFITDQAYAFSDSMKIRVVETRPSYFGSVSIADVTKEGRHVSRALLNDGLVQNRFNAQNQSITPYTFALSGLKMGTRPEAKSALTLGVGAGVVPMDFARSGMSVDAVEINPEMIALARKYFDFDDSMVNVSLQDARTAVSHCNKKYDVVTVDLFNGDGVPEHLVTKEFFADIAYCMTPDAIVIMNSFMYIPDQSAHYALIATLLDVFDGVYMMIKPVYKHGHYLTGAYLVAGNGLEKEDVGVDFRAAPTWISRDLLVGHENALWFERGDERLKNSPILSDRQSSWKYLIADAEYYFRQNLVETLPWQVLMN